MKKKGLVKSLPKSRDLSYFSHTTFAQDKVPMTLRKGDLRSLPIVFLVRKTSIRIIRLFGK